MKLHSSSTGGNELYLDCFVVRWCLACFDLMGAVGLISFDLNGKCDEFKERCEREFRRTLKLRQSNAAALK